MAAVDWYVGWFPPDETASSLERCILAVRAELETAFRDSLRNLAEAHDDHPWYVRFYSELKDGEAENAERLALELSHDPELADALFGKWAPLAVDLAKAFGLVQDALIGTRGVEQTQDLLHALERAAALAHRLGNDELMGRLVALAVFCLQKDSCDWAGVLTREAEISEQEIDAAEWFDELYPLRQLIAASGRFELSWVELDDEPSSDFEYAFGSSSHVHGKGMQPLAGWPKSRQALSIAEAEEYLRQASDEIRLHNASGCEIEWAAGRWQCLGQARAATSADQIHPEALSMPGGEPVEPKQSVYPAMPAPLRLAFDPAEVLRSVEGGDFRELMEAIADDLSGHLEFLLWDRLDKLGPSWTDRYADLYLNLDNEEYPEIVEEVVDDLALFAYVFEDSPAGLREGLPAIGEFIAHVHDGYDWEDAEEVRAELEAMLTGLWLFDQELHAFVLTIMLLATIDFEGTLRGVVGSTFESDEVAASSEEPWRATWGDVVLDFDHLVLDPDVTSGLEQMPRLPLHMIDAEDHVHTFGPPIGHWIEGLYSLLPQLSGAEAELQPFAPVRLTDHNCIVKFVRGRWCCLGDALQYQVLPA